MSNEPNWSLLPAHAEEFFGLEAEYTRSDLKRSYNRILRQYKPEQFPEEFQLLRAAYEELEDALRYGTRMASPSATPLPMEALADAVFAGSVVEQPALSERFESLGAVGLFSELTGQDTRTAEEWLALALFREAAEDAPPLALHTTLMEGIIATQGDDLVVNALVGACRDPLSVKDAGKLVLVLARWIQEESPHATNWYYYVSGPLWVFLVTAVPFHTFKSLLERCRERIGLEGHMGYLTLVLRLLRKGGLVADPEWVRAAMEELYESYDGLPRDLSDEVDLLEWLHTYMGHREEFLMEHPGRAPWDAALVAILSEDEMAADRAFLTATSAALDDPDTLLEAFQPEAENVGCAITPLYAFSAESYARMQEPEELRTPETLRRVIVPFLFRLEKISERGLVGRTDEAIGFVRFLLIMLGLILPSVLFESYLSDAWLGGITIVTTVGGFFAGSKVVGWAFNTHSSRMYRKVWRPQVREFLEANPMNMYEFVETVENTEDKGITNQYRLVSQLNMDPGMVLYALSLRFAQ